jgi:hypothetical protein
MAGSSIAGIITAVASCLLAAGTLTAAIAGLIPMLKAVRRTEKIAVNTHDLVNSRYANIENFNRALVRALNEAGIKVPVDQSLPDLPAKDSLKPD